jgi:thioredoxin 1
LNLSSHSPRRFQINSGKTVLIDFHADWSGLCRSTSQQFSELSDTFVRIGVDFYRVNVDELEDVVMEADVRVVCIFHMTPLSSQFKPRNITGPHLYGVQGREEGWACHGRGWIEFACEFLVFDVVHLTDSFVRHG